MGFTCFPVESNSQRLVGKKEKKCIDMFTSMDDRENFSNEYPKSIV